MQEEEEGLFKADAGEEGGLFTARRRSLWRVIYSMKGHQARQEEQEKEEEERVFRGYRCQRGGGGGGGGKFIQGPALSGPAGGHDGTTTRNSSAYEGSSFLLSLALSFSRSRSRSFSRSRSRALSLARSLSRSFSRSLSRSRSRTLSRSLSRLLSLSLSLSLSPPRSRSHTGSLGSFTHTPIHERTHIES